MKARIAFVSGAAGFIGRRVVAALSGRGVHVRAGVRRPGDLDGLARLEGVEPVRAEILERGSLMEALKGVDLVFHFAALVDSHTPREVLRRINAEGTRNVWTCAAASGVRGALYCSSAAVYGLLAGVHQPVSEEITPRAVEPYGNSKLLGEEAAREVARGSGLPTVVIRPVAVFGPGQRTPFGEQLRAALFSRLLLAEGFRNRKFSFVHVEDVAEAAVHLMLALPAGDRIYNIAVDDPIQFEDAFQAYLAVLGRAGRRYARARFFARLSEKLHDRPSVSRWVRRVGGGRLAFGLWQPGFDMTYSAKKLLGTSFRFSWQKFEDVLESCADNEA